MQASPGQVAQAGNSGSSGEFFIPDLCAPRSVFAMVLLVVAAMIGYWLYERYRRQGRLATTDPVTE